MALHKHIRPKSSNTNIVVTWNNAPAIASCPCNAALTQRGSVNMWLLTHHHIRPTWTLDVPCMPVCAAVVPLHKSQVGMPQCWGQRSARASESRRRNWTVDLQRMAEVLPRSALWVSICGYSGKAAVRSTGHAWAARSRGQPMFLIRPSASYAGCQRCCTPLRISTAWSRLHCRVLSQGCSGFHVQIQYDI